MLHSIASDGDGGGQPIIVRGPQLAHVARTAIHTHRRGSELQLEQYGAAQPRPERLVELPPLYVNGRAISAMAVYKLGAHAQEWVEATTWWKRELKDEQGAREPVFAKLRRGQQEFEARDMPVAAMVFGQCLRRLEMMPLSSSSSSSSTVDNDFLLQYYQSQPQRTPHGQQFHRALFETPNLPFAIERKGFTFDKGYTVRFVYQITPQAPAASADAQSLFNQLAVHFLGLELLGRVRGSHAICVLGPVEYVPPLTLQDGTCQNEAPSVLDLQRRLVRLNQLKGDAASILTPLVSPEHAQIHVAYTLEAVRFNAFHEPIWQRAYLPMSVSTALEFATRYTLALPRSQAKAHAALTREKKALADKFKNLDPERVKQEVRSQWTSHVQTYRTLLNELRAEVLQSSSSRQTREDLPRLLSHSIWAAVQGQRLPQWPLVRGLQDSFRAFLTFVHDTWAWGAKQLINRTWLEYHAHDLPEERPQRLRALGAAATITGMYLRRPWSLMQRIVNSQHAATAAKDDRLLATAIDPTEAFPHHLTRVLLHEARVEHQATIQNAQQRLLQGENFCFHNMVTEGDTTILKTQVAATRDVALDQSLQHAERTQALLKALRDVVSLAHRYMDVQRQRTINDNLRTSIQSLEETPTQVVFVDDDDNASGNVGAKSHAIRRVSLNERLTRLCNEARNTPLPIDIPL